MRFLKSFVPAVYALIFVGGGLVPYSTSNADEPAAAFLAALVDARLYEVAEDYLEKAKNSDLVAKDFRNRVPYEQAKILVRSAAADRDQQESERKFNLADKLLNGYANGLKDPVDKFNVVLESANIKVKRSESLLTRSEKARVPEKEKKTMLKKADSLLRAAMKQYDTGQPQLRKVLKNFKLDPEDKKSVERKEKLQKQFLSIRTQLPLVSERLADTLPDNSAERKTLLKKAVEQSEDVYETYRKIKKQAFIFTAATNGARASQKLGNHKKALELLDHVFDIGDGAAEDRLKRNAMVVAVDSWSKTKPYPWEKVIEVVEKRVARLNRSEVNRSDWQRIQLELVNAKLSKAADIRKKGGAKSGGKAKTQESEASKIIRKIVRSNGPHKELAKSIVAKWKLSFSETASETVEVESFGDAKELAGELTSDVVALQSEVRKQQSMLSQTSDSGKKADLASALEENTALLTEKADSALAFYEKALAMADESTNRADINFLRYHQSICHFAKGQPLHSALIAEFLLEKYPTTAWTRQASANIVKGYSAMLSAAAAEDKEYESNRLQNACREICKRWPASNESALAATTIVQSSIRAKDLATAEEFFKLIPDTFSSKPLLAAALGERLWADYVTNKELDEASRKKRLQEATNMLELVVVVPPETITYPSANAAKTLVNALIEQNQIPQAIERLETGKMAPLKLLKDKHPAIANSKYADRFRQSTNRTAIKAYLAAVSSGHQPKKSIDKAISIVTSMQQELKKSNDPKVKAQLSGIYQRVGKTLKGQFDGIKELDAQKKFATVIAKFVGTVEKGANDTGTLLWAGKTLQEVATSLSEAGASKEAGPLFKQANSTLDRAKKLGLNDPNSKLALQHLQALALRGSGQYQKSIDIFEELLKKKALLTWQLDAAETLQMWGKNEKNSNAYAQSMMGTGRYKDPKTKREKNAIWGWRKLVQATRGNEKFNDAFRTSIYNSVKARFEFGLLEKDKTRSKKAIQSSYSELSKSLKRFAFLNNGPWGDKFQALLADIKKHK